MCSQQRGGITIGANSRSYALTYLPELLYVSTIVQSGTNSYIGINRPVITCDYWHRNISWASNICYENSNCAEEKRNYGNYEKLRVDTANWTGTPVITKTVIRNLGVPCSIFQNILDDG